MSAVLPRVFSHEFVRAIEAVYQLFVDGWYDHIPIDEEWAEEEYWIKFCISRLPGSLIPLPKIGFDRIHVRFGVEDNDHGWIVSVPLWTEEEGESAARVHFRMVRDADEFKLYLQSIDHIDVILPFQSGQIQ